MNKYLIGLFVVFALALYVAMGKIDSLNVQLGSLKVELITANKKADKYKELYDTEHKIVMENNTIDKKVKEKIRHALDIIERAYNGTVVIN